MLSSLFTGANENSPKQDVDIKDKEKFIARIIGRMRQAGRITEKKQIKPYRNSIGRNLGLSGNKLSALAVLDMGDREVVLLVSEKVAGQADHMELREHLFKEHYKLTDERFADAAVIAEINQAIGSHGKESQQSDVFPLIEELLYYCIREKSSNIHLRVRGTIGEAKHRVHGRVYKYKDYDVETCNQMAGYMYNFMAEKRTQSSGTFSLENKSMSCMLQVTYDGQSYKLRYKFIRLANGWHLSIRILPLEIPGQKAITFDDLGYAESQINQLKMSVVKSIGLIALTGPTGSGKSTSLKVMMEFDPNKDFRIRIGVEDPVEYDIKDTSLISIQRNDHELEDDDKAWIGVLRDVLRGDPDDIMVGETRDKATAKIVADLVLTGHKIYTTLHTHSAIGSILRLSRLGLDRQVISDRQFITALIFQRLLPVLCENCKQPASDILSPRIKNLLVNKFNLDISKIYCSHENGCEQCKNRGIVGSTVVAEVVIPDKVFRQHIAAGEDLKAEIYWRKSRTAGFDEPNMDGKTAFEHGLFKVSQGLIDPRDLEIEFESFESYEVIKIEDDQ